MHAPPPASFSIAWFCPIEVEQIAARAALESQYEDSSEGYKKSHGIESDDNTYCFGRIGNYEVVLARPQADGAAHAAAATKDLIRSFPGLKHFLLAGVAGGVPYEDPQKPDVRLGDVVVSIQTKDHSGMVQFEYGRQYRSEDLDGFKDTGHTRAPEGLLQRCAKAIISPFDRQHSDELDGFHRNVRELLERCPTDSYHWQRPITAHVAIPSREDTSPKLHGGLIASSSKVVQDAGFRDAKVKQFQDRGDILAFEMEGYAVASLTPCLHIRGICDYADKSKNQEWQPYAAILAAAFCKSVILGLPSVNTASKNPEAASASRHRFDNFTFEQPQDTVSRRQTAPSGRECDEVSFLNSLPVYPTMERKLKGKKSLDEPIYTEEPDPFVRREKTTFSTFYKKPPESRHPPLHPRTASMPLPPSQPLEDRPLQRRILRPSLQTYSPTFKEEACLKLAPKDVELDGKIFAQCQCTLRHVRDPNFSFSTKILEIACHPDIEITQWIPSDSILATEEEAYQAYEWSDCGQIAERTENGYTEAKYSYFPSQPNHKLRLRFDNTEETERFNELIFDLGLDQENFDTLFDKLFDHTGDELTIFKSQSPAVSPGKGISEQLYIAVSAVRRQEDQRAMSRQVFRLSPELTLSVLDKTEEQQIAHLVYIADLESLHYINPTQRRNSKLLAEEVKTSVPGMPTGETWVKEPLKYPMQAPSVCLDMDTFLAIVEHTSGWQSWHRGSAKGLRAFKSRTILSSNLMTTGPCFMFLGKRNDHNAQIFVQELPAGRNAIKSNWHFFELPQGPPNILEEPSDKRHGQILVIPVQTWKMMNGLGLATVGKPLEGAKPAAKLKIEFNEGNDCDRVRQRLGAMRPSMMSSRRSTLPMTLDSSGGSRSSYSTRSSLVKWQSESS